MYFLYTALYALALVLALPYWLVAMLRAGKYRAGLKERFGFIPNRLKLPKDGERVVWFHAVSVGEVLAVSALVRSLASELPDAPIFLSTTTLAGQTLARQRFGEEKVFYMPLDVPWAINPVLRALRPKLLVLAETEFWPNVLRLAKAHDAQIAVVNARISDRSFPGYRRFRRLLAPVLANVSCFLAQGENDRERLIAIGAEPARISVSGNLKFEPKPPAATEFCRGLRQAIENAGPALVFGSTVDGEEELLLPAFKSVLKDFPDSVIVLAPRHPERFDRVAELLRDAGLSFCRRSSWNGTTLEGGVMLLDSIGELASVYSLAEVAFVGGSLVPRGGHNILEPAQFAKPIIIGPHYENFREIVRDFVSANAVCIAAAEVFTDTLLQLLRSPAAREALGTRAAAVVARGQGSTERTLHALLELLQPSSARNEQLVAPRA
ncbi:MAG: 3-deoxy-D-manno-octulosonic acid transferase [Acidobacteria bacterium]|nr:3-deoxy-D-manno-octulosonic acid transferase [Acidobacteriota bacterium]